MFAELPPYLPPPPTSETLDYAPLDVINMNLFDSSPAERQRLADQLKNASHNMGFLVVSGHGILDTEIQRQLAIGQAFFKLSLEEKRKYPCDFAGGRYLGYREPTRYIADTNVKENHEMMNIAKFCGNEPRFPLHDFLIQYKDEIAAFQKKVYTSVLERLLILLELALELPENFLVKLHDYEKGGEDYLSYKLYHSRSDEEWTEIKDKFRPGHTDFGSITLVFSQTQTVSGLQIRTPQGEWKHVQSIPDGITVNIGDTLSMLTNGFFKSTVHGVARPPPDQQHYDRLALLYFLRLNDDAEILPVDSPYLKRIGWPEAEKDNVSATGSVSGSEWLKARIHAYNHRKTIESTSEPLEFAYRGLKVQVQY